MPSAPSVESVLWGKNGEKWTPESRLPDFSHAGYHQGDSPIPLLPPGVSVKEFGAVGDGKTDDSEAFLKAISKVNGAIEVPPGRYVITKILEINRPGVVLRGTDPEQSILVCPVPLNDIRTDWGATTEGKKTSNYSWSGGMVWFEGEIPETVLTVITSDLPRGARELPLASTLGLKTGQQIMIRLNDSTENSLASHLYSGDAGKTECLLGSTHARLVCRILSISGNNIVIDRPLRFDIQQRWKPEIRSFEPAVHDSGIENIGFEFPDTPYGGHFSELGHNAIAFGKVSDCWARNIRMINADSGIFAEGFFCTAENVIFNNVRQGDEGGNSGHHGVYFGGDDNLLSNFDYRTKFIHDIGISRGAGNVFAEGKGLDLCLDHHKRAPYENLFTNLDAGLGTRLWACGGGADLGKNCATRGTFWNIRAKNPLLYPPADFAPVTINVVGLTTDQPAETNPQGKWFEVFQDLQIKPENLHKAQLKRRLALEKTAKP